MRTLAILALLVSAFPAEALTLHRSFQPTGYSASVATAEKKKTLSGNVVEVVDGDTIYVKPSGGVTRYKVQLFRIDAPELAEPFGPEAKKFLEDLILGKKVDVQYLPSDRKGNSLGGVVYMKHGKGAVDVNLTMLLNGMARHNDKADDTEIYAKAAAKARAAKLGLWADQS